MRSRLDRAVANSAWNQVHENAAIIHLEFNHSDHHPIFLDTEYYAPAGSQLIGKIIVSQNGSEKRTSERW
jgi:glutathionylspermidine synthase